VVLMYSEIDPALHTAVATGNYGIAPYTSTINYAPKYFLINGEAYTTASADIPAGAAGQRTLLRLLNAGLESHFPTLVGSSLSLIAEYGNPYPYARDQFSTLLAAGMTQDAILAPSVNGRLPLFDRHLRLTNATASPGGLMSFLAIGAGGPPPPPPVVPTAVNDVASTAEDTAVAIDVAANDTAVNVATVTTTAPLNGTTVVDATTGVVTYTPNLNYSGADTFGYSIAATDGLSTVSATVNLTITAVNDAPVANTNAYTMTAGTTLNVAATGVLANDTDVDSAGLTAVLGTTTAGGALTLNADGSFSYTPNAATTTDSFTYVANDGVADSAPASVTITVNPAVNVAPVAVADFATVTRNVRTTNPKNFVTINLIANDTDANNNIDPASIQIRTNPRKGTVVVNGDGTVTYTPANGKTGADAFSYRVRDLGGLLSNTVTVRINIL
jgi:VCBS repeat-containing protein